MSLLGYRRCCLPNWHNCLIISTYWKYNLLVFNRNFSHVAVINYVVVNSCRKYEKCLRVLLYPNNDSCSSYQDTFKTENEQQRSASGTNFLTFLLSWAWLAQPRSLLSRIKFVFFLLLTMKVDLSYWKQNYKHH